MDVKYIGGADSYGIEEEDLTRHGVAEEDATAAVWDNSNGFIVELSQAAGEKLIELMPESFVEAVGDNASPIVRPDVLTDASVAPSGAGIASSSHHVDSDTSDS